MWSLRSNICDIPTDCPQRERAGWTGDWQVFAPTAAYLYDVLAFTRKWLGDVMLDQRADGASPTCRRARRPRASTGRSAGCTARRAGATSWCRRPGTCTRRTATHRCSRDVGGDDGLGPVRRGGGRGRPASRPGRGAARTRRARAVSVGHRLPLGRVDGAGRGGRRLPGVRPGGQVRGGHGLPVSFGGDRGPGGRGARAARGPVAPLPRDRGGGAGRLAAGVRPGRRDARRADAGLARAGAGVRAGAGGTPAGGRRAAGRAGRPGRRPPRDRLPVHRLPAARAGRRRVPGPGLRAAAAGHRAVLADDGGPGRDDPVGALGRRGLPRRPARVAEPLQQGRGGHVPAPLRRGAAPGRAGYRPFEVRPRPGGGITSASARHMARSVPSMWPGVLPADRWSWTCWCRAGTTATVVMPGGEPHDVGPGRHHWTGAAPTG